MFFMFVPNVTTPFEKVLIFFGCDHFKSKDLIVFQKFEFQYTHKKKMPKEEKEYEKKKMTIMTKKKMKKHKK